VQEEVEEATEQDTATTEAVDVEEEVAEEEIELPENPLAGQDVTYPGSYGENDPEAIECIVSFIELMAANIDADKISVVNADDFEGTGEVGAFIYVSGEDDENEADAEFSDNYYTGQLYYVGNNEVYELNHSSTDAWRVVDGVIRTEKRQYAFATEYYATGGRAIVWSVYDGEPKECEVSGLGDLAQDENGVISIVASAYDVMYDPTIGDFLGHSWKPYYFYYDENDDVIKEYGGARVLKDQINELAGIDILSQIDKAGGTFTTAYYHENGILNVNYLFSGEGDSEIQYGNATYDCKNSTYIPAFGGQDSSFEGSNAGGVYVDRIGRGFCDVTYPEVAVNKETIDVVVLDSADVVPLFNGEGFQINGRDMYSWSTPVSVVIDRDTVFGPDGGNYFSGREDGMDAVMWIDSLKRSDNFMDIRGVYSVEVTNGHVDVIDGLFWWD